MKYYTWILRTLSPVHIGCGHTLTKLDYAYSASSRRIYVMQPQLLFQALLKRNLLEDFEKCIRSGDQQFSLTNFFRKANILEEEYADWVQYSYPVQNVSIGSGQAGIHAFVKDPYGCPYIPGSGIKGALRTAIAYAEIYNHQESFRDIADHVESELKFKNPKGKEQLSAKAEQRIFHTLKRKENNRAKNEHDRWKDIVNDCMAGLRISDSTPLMPDTLVLCEKNDLDIDGEDHSINLLRECLKPGTELQFDVTVDEKLFPWDMDAVMAHLKVAFDDYDYLFRSVFINNAKDTFHLPEETAEGEYLYLGGGTGYLNKTFLYALYEDEKEAAELVSLLLDKSFPKHRHRSFTAQEGLSPRVFKCTRYNEQLYEMGLCQLEIKEKKL